MSSLASLVPVAISATMVAITVYERAEDGARDAGVATAALASLALFLLSLSASDPPRGYVLAAVVAVTLWLAGRVRKDARLAPPLAFILGAVAGVSPRVGLALLPVVCVEIVRGLGSVQLRSVGRLMVVLVAGVCLAQLAPDPHLHQALLPTRESLLAWIASSSRSVGAAGLAIAASGIALGISGSRTRRAVSLSVLLLALGEAATGHAGPVSALALAMGAGFAIMEAGAFAARSALPGAGLALAPLVLLLVAEPLAGRVESARWSAPSFGPIPPPATPRR